jgi:type II secretory pathway pseudopilin PulG
MRIVRQRAGLTLADLIITLSILGIVLGMAAPRVAALRAHGAVRSARDAAAAAVERARSLAVARGTARVTVDPSAGTIVIESPIGLAVDPVLRLGEAYGVSVGVGGTGVPVSLDFNAIGLGVVASRTITLSRGPAQAGLSVSSYGRVRRW